MHIFPTVARKWLQNCLLVQLHISLISKESKSTTSCGCVRLQEVSTLVIVRQRTLITYLFAVSLPFFLVRGKVTQKLESRVLNFDIRPAKNPGKNLQAFVRSSIQFSTITFYSDDLYLPHQKVPPNPPFSYHSVPLTHTIT